MIALLEKLDIVNTKHIPIVLNINRALFKGVEKVFI